MDHIFIFQKTPEGQGVEGFAKDRAQKRYSFDPAEPIRETGIDWNQMRFQIRIFLPIPHQQISLHRLAADVAQTGRHKSDTKTGSAPGGDRRLQRRSGRSLAAWTLLASTSEYSSQYWSRTCSMLNCCWAYLAARPSDILFSVVRPKEPAQVRRRVPRRRPEQPALPDHLRRVHSSPNGSGHDCNSSSHGFEHDIRETL